MMRAFLISLALITTIFSAMTPALFAQQSPPAGQHDDITGLEIQPGRGNPLSEEQREEIRKKIETIRIWRLTEKLNLDTTTSAKLASLLNSCDQQRQGIVKEQMATMREMRVLLRAPKIDETRIKTAIDKLQKYQRSLQELREKEYSGLKDILTIEQQARFLLFQQEFRHEIQRMISNARNNSRGKGPGAGQ
ncbi:MAG TPA: periplasmic heavy metal sensor [Nitrospirota bacterium]|nr:periplasmic heavy metal sensor [Nitrospirota bacterium]